MNKDIKKLIIKSEEIIDISGIRTQDNQEAMVRLKSCRYYDVVPIWEEMVDEVEGPIYQQYIKENMWYQDVYVRSSISKMLEDVSSLLPKNWRLIVRAGHRPVKVQNELLEMIKKQYEESNPNCTDSEALEYARTFVSDPLIKVPPHCCAAAIDIDVLQTNDSSLVDFGTSVNTDSELSFLHSRDISERAQKNRSILLGAMMTAGFTPFYHEWWHYSYGDEMWAAFYGKPNATYGIVTDDDLKGQLSSYNSNNKTNK